MSAKSNHTESVALIHRLTQIMIDCGILFFLFLLITLPYSINWYLPRVGLQNAPSAARAFAVTAAASGVAAVVLLICLHLIIINCIADKPFIRENTRLLLIAAICCFGITTTYIPIILLYNLYSAYVVCAVFFFAGILALTVRLVLQKAIEIREENDLTI